MPGVSANFLPLISATVFFVASHFVLSFGPIRARLVGGLGEPVFLALYSLIAVGGFAWMVFAYIHAPFHDLWGDPAWARWASVALMPFAAVLVVTGVGTANPGAVRYARPADPGRGPVGIQKVTRHPVMIAAALWAVLHLITNGDAASTILFGGMLVLTLGGIAHIEARKRATGGETWARFAAQSSVIPFVAIAQGRARVGLGEIGWNRIAIGVVLYLVMLFGHRVVIDAPILPDLLGG